MMWWQSLPKGDHTGSTISRQEIMKNTLRAGLKKPLVNYRERGGDDIETIKAELSAVKQVVAHLPSKLKGSDVDDRLSALETMLNTELSKVGQWIEYLTAQVDHLSTNGISAPPAPPVVTEAPQLSTDEQQQRANKLKKAKW